MLHCAFSAGMFSAGKHVGVGSHAPVTESIGGLGNAQRHLARTALPSTCLSGRNPGSPLRLTPPARPERPPRRVLPGDSEGISLPRRQGRYRPHHPVSPRPRLQPQHGRRMGQHRPPTWLLAGGPDWATWLVERHLARPRSS